VSKAEWAVAEDREEKGRGKRGQMGGCHPGVRTREGRGYTVPRGVNYFHMHV
jgi:hypothetical protein